MSQVISSGVLIPTFVRNSDDPKEAEGAKTYYHQFPGAGFTMPDGREIRFMGGMFSTKDKDVIYELDKIADKAASKVFSDRRYVPQSAIESALSQEAQGTVASIAGAAPLPAAAGR